MRVFQDTTGDTDGGVYLLLFVIEPLPARALSAVINAHSEKNESFYLPNDDTSCILYAWRRQKLLQFSPAP